MAKFCELGIETNIIVGKGIDIDELFDKRILIEKTVIAPTKYPGKNSSGLRMQMQVCLATFNDTPDAHGDYYVKDASGQPVGERRSCFTGSDLLISSIQKGETNIPAINEQRRANGQPPIALYPMDTTIVKIGKCFQFT